MNPVAAEKKTSPTDGPPAPRGGVSAWIEAARPKTLPAAVVPVLIGSALAWRAGQFEWAPAVVCMAFALLVQIGTNFANDYGDFVTGADGPDRLGPRRAVASGMVSPNRMRVGFVATFGLAFVIGLSLIYWGGWVLLPVGLASLFFGWAYTGGPFPLAYHGLGDVFVFVFFGLVAVGGTFYVMAGSLPWWVLLAAVPVGLLATNILVVNNCRDRETDERANKRTLIVRYGHRFGVAQYVVSLVVSAVVPVALAMFLGSAWLAIPGLVPVLGMGLGRKLASNPPGPVMNELLAQTAKLLLVFGVAWGGAIALG